MDYKSKIFLIAGPTASGKSKIAINLAKKINGEIVNADSMQVYKQLKYLQQGLRKKIKKLLNTIYSAPLMCEKDFQQVNGLKNVSK